MSWRNEPEQDRLTEFFATCRSTIIYIAFQTLNDRRLAEDAVLKTSEKIARYFDKIISLPRHQVKRYIVILARNTARNLGIMKGIIREKSGEIEDMINRDIFVERITSDEGVELMAMAIESLPEELSDVLLFSMVYRHTNDEIAKLLDIKPDDVQKRLILAKEAVEKVLGGETNG